MFWTIWGPGKSIPLVEGGYATGPWPAALIPTTPTVAAARGAWYASRERNGDRADVTADATRQARPTTPAGRTFIGALVNIAAAAFGTLFGPTFGPSAAAYARSSIRIPVSVEEDAPLGREDASLREQVLERFGGEALGISEGVRITRGSGEYPAQTVVVQTAQGPQTVEVPAIPTTPTGAIAMPRERDGGDGYTPSRTGGAAATGAAAGAAAGQDAAPSGPEYYDPGSALLAV